MNKRLWTTLFSALVIGLLSIVSQKAAAYPKCVGPINDYAHLLNQGDQQQLERELRAHKERTGEEVTIVTISSLDGENIEQYSTGLFRECGLGQKDKNNGVLLLVAKSDRKVRIETGYGSEGILTDIESGKIIRNVIAPKTKQGDWSGGISDGAHTILNVLDKNPNAIPASPNAELSPGVIILLIFILILLVIVVAALRSRSSYGGSSSSSIWISGGGGGSSGGGDWGGGGSSGGGGASGDC